MLERLTVNSVPPTFEWCTSRPAAVEALIRKAVVPFVATAVLAASIPALAQTQTGTIKGSVTDASGQAVPGVTVTVSSRALMTGQQTATTGLSGAYQFIALPPATYDLTFELAGFVTVESKGLRVGVATVSTVDARLEIAAIAESVTVVGGAPTVDVASNTLGTAFNRQVLEEIPTGRDPWALAQLVPGMQMSRFDVGGSDGMQGSAGEIHGSASTQTEYAIDGVKVNWAGGSGGSTMIYYDFGQFEEVSYQTNALSAEAEVGGVSVNMVTKSGGNEFSGEGLYYYQGPALQSDNLNDRLRERGASSGNPMETFYDVNGNLGGRIIRDRLWFFTSFRWWRADYLQLGTINPDGSQAIDDNRIINGMGKVTLQLTPNQKFMATYNKNWKDRFHRRFISGLGTVQFTPDQATVRQNQTGFSSGVQWNWVMTDRTYLDARFAVTHLDYTLGYQPTIKAADISRRELSTNSLRVAAPWDRLNLPWSYQWRGSVSLFRDDLWSGYHDMKVGVQIAHNVNEFRFIANGDLRQEYLNGVPLQVVTYNTPVNEIAMFDTIGVFAQDSYTVGRATINAGARVDWLEGYLPAQTSPAGRFVGDRTVNETRNIPRWLNVAPRLGASYALGPSKRSSLKASYSRYYFQIGADYISAANPVGFSTAVRSWQDLNGDDIAQDEELGPSTGFAGGATQRLADGLARPYSDEYTVGVNHDLGQSVGVGVFYFHRRNKAQLSAMNVAVTPQDYVPIAVPDPTTGGTITVYNQERSTVGLVDRVITNADVLDTEYNGVEFTVTKRMSDGWHLSGGLTIGRNEGGFNRGVSSDDLNNPNRNTNRRGVVGNDATYIGKLAGGFSLPAGISLSGALRYSTGYPLTRVLIVRGLNQASEQIFVAPRGEFRLENVAIVDLRVGKSLNLRGAKATASMDVFNVLNGNSVLSEVTTVGATLGRPSSILPPRVVRFGIAVAF